MLLVSSNDNRTGGRANRFYTEYVKVEVSAVTLQTGHRMGKTPQNSGSVILMTVFVVAILSAVVMGMLQMNTEEIQLMQNQVYAAEALATAEAGLNDALAQIRVNALWSSGFTNKLFNGGSYTVVVNGSTVTSTGTSSRGFVAKVEARVTVASSGPPYVIRIDSLRINE